VKRIVNSDWFAGNLGFLVGVLGVGSEAYKDFSVTMRCSLLLSLTVPALVDLAPLDLTGTWYVLPDRPDRRVLS
jgi:hypothetical protein